MRDILKAILTIWYLVLGIAFILLAFISISVFLGLTGGGKNAWWVGLLGTATFWKASSVYREKFRERVEKISENSRKDDNDET